MKIGEQVKMYRKHRGVSQEDLALEIGVHRETISRIERNQSEASISLLTKVGTSLSCTFTI